MRQHRSWAWLASLVLVGGLGVAPCDAQMPPGAGYPAAPPGAPPMYSGYPGGVDYAGYPPTMAPWPAVSPYESSFSQHLNVDGVWMTESNNSTGSDYLILESLVSRFKAPEKNLVGSFGVPREEGNLFSPVDLGVFGAATENEPLGLDLFAIGDTREHDPTSPGIRLLWGRTNPDGSGLEFSGYWSSDASFLFRRGSPFAHADEISSLRVTAGVPLDDGDGGSVVPYDRFFELTFNSEAFESDLLWVNTRRWSLGPLDIQPVYGLRYMFVRERMTFTGRDSGLAVTFLPTGMPDLEAETAFIVPQFESSLLSSVRSHLAGPQFGFRYGMGGDFLHLSGESRIGILANREKIELRGNGIGDGFSPDFQQNSPFSDRRVHTHVSPMLEQKVNADLKIFSVIPILRRFHFLEQAKLRVGYSITGVWEMARPSSSFEWYGLPKYPRIREDREKWHIQSWHFGLHWNY